ncbi:hypothetical protein CDV55_102025 [Aspergillus turcosus]|uniref:Uncharacterized protein n=1 Tax=Aspergillus turcosus TaxID=1245748 RepID=A0A229X640_9EURO|nr:hypothetical protein CDV55_102025 [Aspergillus turcosus]RLL95475.1 hypothetical protein CFD26_104630 [Aspergillus turcosus]
MKILHTPPRYLTQDLVVIGTGLRLKTNMPPDVLDSRVKLCIELGDYYTTLRDEAMSYTWGAADRWLGAMQYSVTQQALRLDLCAYLIAIALWNNGEWRLTPFPTPARFITEQMRLERLRNTLLGPDDIPDFDIPETMEEWEDLVARAKLDKMTINTLPGDMFKSASQVTQKQFAMLRIYAPKLSIEDNREAREDDGLPKWAFDKASNTFGNPQNGEIFLESSRQTRRSTVSGSNTMILMDGHR